MSLFVLLALFAGGLASGALTTLAGLGGGILLIAGMTLFFPPAMVLGMTAPALFIGNASRVYFLRDAVDWRMVGRFAATGVPTAFAASLVAALAPGALIRAAIALLLLVYVAYELFRPAAPTSQAPRPWLPAATGAITGTVSGLTGGGGFIATPLLERTGLSPARIVATSGACMALVHLVKGLGFSATSVLTPALLPAAAVLTVGVLAGNAMGAPLLKRLSRQTFRRLLLAALTLTSLQLLVSAL